jgi:hypothetical protein
MSALKLNYRVSPHQGRRKNTAATPHEFVEAICSPARNAGEYTEANVNPIQSLGTAYVVGTVLYIGGIVLAQSASGVSSLMSEISLIRRLFTRRGLRRLRTDSWKRQLPEIVC